MFILQSPSRSWACLCILLIIPQAVTQPFRLISKLSPSPALSNQGQSGDGTNQLANSSTDAVFQSSTIESRPIPPILAPGLSSKDPQPRKGLAWNSIIDMPDKSGLLIDRANDHDIPQTALRADSNTDFFTNNITARELDSRATSTESTLRILPLGASITWGQGSTDGNGYRFGLRGALVKAGYVVNMIGSVNHGNMADNQVEGWPGAIISDIYSKVELSLPSRPNVVIIQLGSNDLSTNTDPANAANRMGTLVDKIFTAVPETMILISSLMPMSNTAAEKLSVETYNPGLRQMVQNKFIEGKSIYFIDMHTGYITLNDLADGLHPNNGGFLKMARLYYDTLIRVSSLIKPPQTVSGVNDAAAPNDGSTDIDTKCQMDLANAVAPVVTQQGSGETDGPYKHNGVDRGTIFTWGQTTNPSQAPVFAGIFWADVNGDGDDDLLYIPTNFKQYELHISQGAGKFAAPILVSTNIDCPTAGINFADSNDNGYDDLFCVDATGNLRIWQNIVISTSPFATSWVGSTNVDIASKSGYPQSRVRIGDIDGDGRADYIVIHDNGDLEAWRNAGVLATVESWQYLGLVSTGKTFADLQGIRLVDLNGDGRADLLWMTDGGQVTTWINQRGFSSGSIAPTWMPSIVTHGGPGTAGTRAKITFGRVWNPTTGNSDYIQASATGIQIYENQGTGGRYVAGDGVYYCDMTGDGADDYIYVGPTGDFTLFGNLRSPPAWQQYGVIYHRTLASRKVLHFADWNGDGRCDILVVDKYTGQVTMGRNDGFVNGKLTFWEYGLVSSTASCTQGYGSAYGDLGVRFAHLSGKPRVDYLCIQKNGVTSGYFNRGLGDMVDIGQIKAGVGTDRASIRYADVNGDGRDDFLWVDRFSGETQVWTNEGEDASRPAGSAYRWQFRGVVANGGVTRGANIYWANIHGQGRADQIINDPASNHALAYFNVCPLKPGPPPNLPAGPA